MTKEVLKLALEALYALAAMNHTTQQMKSNAINAIKEALAQPESDYERGFIDGMQKQMQSSVDKAVNRMTQPEQEPVAYGTWDTMLGKGNRMMMVRLDKGQDGCTVPLYTTPPQRTWVGLTPTQVKLLWGGVQEEAVKSGDSLNWVFYMHINEALKEKNR